MQFDMASYVFMGSVPLILAFVQITKSWVKDSRLYPVASILYGILINLIVGWKQTGIRELFLMGIIAGFTACGAYSAYQESKTIGTK